MKIVTFNILTNGYAIPKQYPNLEVDVLNQQKRWNATAEILKSFVNQKCIILLQEVSLQQREKLEVFSRENNYECISTNYGNIHSGFMGVATLFPSYYKLIRCQFFSPCALIKSKMPPEVIPFTLKWPTLFSATNWLRRPCLPTIETLYKSQEFLFKWWRGEKDEKKYQSILKHRNNIQLLLELEVEDQKRVVVSNYHAPCVYWNQEAIAVSASLSSYCVKKFANGLPYILGGDYNMSPESLGYKIIVGNCLDDIEDEELRNSIQSLDLDQLNSAYYEIHDEEPEWTSYSECQTHFDKEINKFKGTLDYILIKDLITKDSQTPQHIQGPLPSSENPSDHLYLMAEVDFF